MWYECSLGQRIRAPHLHDLSASANPGPIPIESGYVLRIERCHEEYPNPSTVMRHGDGAQLPRFTVAVS